MTHSDRLSMYQYDEIVFFGECTHERCSQSTLCHLCTFHSNTYMSEDDDSHDGDVAMPVALIALRTDADRPRLFSHSRHKKAFH